MCVWGIFLPSLVSLGQELKKLKQANVLHKETYINTRISHIVAPPCVKLHVEISPAVNCCGRNVK